MACNSSITEQCTFNPSSVFESLDSGLNTPSLKSETISATKQRIRLDNTGDFFTIRLASDQTIFAWSFFVAALTHSGPGSPSAICIYKAMALAHADFPFLRATIKTNSRYFLTPSIL